MDTTGRRIPVTVLTGFLGSGKTTLLNRILSENHGKRIAVIENEFGEIGIDNALVVNADEEIFEMNNGCICCTVRGDLIRILGNLMRRRDKFDYVLVETTGLADPAPVAQTFFVDDEMQQAFELDSIITLVDAKHVSLHIDSSNECKEQIAFADIVLLNKTDLVSNEELDKLEEKIRSMNALTRIHRTQNAKVAMDQILDVNSFDLDKTLSVKPAFLQAEYPFEWAGVLRLAKGEYAMTLEDGPDATMKLCMIQSILATKRAIESLKADTSVAFLSNAAALQPDQVLHPDGSLYDLQLSTPGTKQFRIAVPARGAYVLFTQHLPQEFCMKIGDLDLELAAAATEVFAAQHSHDNSVTSVGIAVDGDVDSDKVNQWLGELLRQRGVDIFRMKGILSIARQKERFVFQGVHMLFDGRPDRSWRKDEPRQNQLVFIGRNLNRQELTAGFLSCLVKTPQPALR